MAFIQLSKAADNPNEALLVNTDHILTVQLGPATNTAGGNTHFVAVNILSTRQVLAYFTSLESAQAAYNRLSACLMPEPQTFALY